jgi:hypothetical protein
LQLAAADKEEVFGAIAAERMARAEADGVVKEVSCVMIISCNLIKHVISNVAIAAKRMARAQRLTVW